MMVYLWRGFPVMMHYFRPLSKVSMSSYSISVDHDLAKKVDEGSKQAKVESISKQSKA
jgi:hypothetical protein